MRTPQLALEKTGIPYWFGAWFGKDGAQPPEEYIVYTLMATPDAFYDDGMRELAVYAYITLWTRYNPNEGIGKVRRAMLADGWAMSDERIDKEEGREGMYRVAWTWKTWEGVDGA